MSKKALVISTSLRIGSKSKILADKFQALQKAYEVGKVVDSEG